MKAHTSVHATGGAEREYLLQETVPKDRVHLECRADDLFGNLPGLERHGSCTPIAVTYRNRLFASLHPIRV
jgi:hypothetical protein